MSEHTNIENPLAKQETIEKPKALFTVSDLVRCIAFLVVGIFLVVSFTMMPETLTYTPTGTEPTERTPDRPHGELVNQMGGSFQPGIEEYEYEEVMVTVRYQPSETLFIGGPRVQSLGTKILTDAQFLCTDSDSPTWLDEEAEFRLEETFDKKLCIVSVGLNNLSEAMQYSQILNSWTTKFPDISFVFVNLGPVDEGRYSGATNGKIQNFNNSMQSLLNDNWRFINLYKHLAENGIEAEDGVNYSDTLNASLFSWILQQADTEERIEYVPIIPEGSSD